MLVEPLSQFLHFLFFLYDPLFDHVAYFDSSFSCLTLSLKVFLIDLQLRNDGQVDSRTIVQAL